MSRDHARHAIRNRLLLSMGLTVLLSVLMTAFVFVVASGTIRTLADRTAEVETMEDGLHALEISLFTQETFVFDYALSERDEALDEFEAATQDATLAYAELRAASLPYPSVVEAVEAVHLTSTAWCEEWAEPFLRSVGTGRAVSDGIAVQASELAIEQMVVELGPGRYGRITASLGVASTEAHIQDMRSLVALADAALYRAKESGRNRVEVAPAANDVTVLSAASRRRRGRVDPDRAESASA